MKGLIIKDKWGSLIISGQNAWEMQSRQREGARAHSLIRRGSKTIVGVPDLVRTSPKLSQTKLPDFVSNIVSHWEPFQATLPE